MVTNSTSKIMDILNKSDRSEQANYSEMPEEIEFNEDFSIPQLTPASVMEQRLTNILGPKSTKKFTPAD